MPTIMTQDRLHITVDSMPGPWQTASGYSGEADTSKFREEAGGAKRAISGPQEYGDVTLERAFVAERDSDLVAALQAEQKFGGTKITIAMMDEAYHVIPGKSITISPCVVKSWEIPEADANSAEVAHLQIVWAVG